MWAPWRMDYILADKDDRCVFCDALDRNDDLTLYKGNTTLVVMNKFPYINGHLMIVPLRHAKDLTGLDSLELDTLIRLVVKCEKALAEGMNCMGMNGGWNLGGCAGAGIEGHIHIHMLPRWSGDTNFMTTTGETRVISASLENSYSRLMPLFIPEVD